MSLPNAYKHQFFFPYISRKKCPTEEHVEWIEANYPDLVPTSIDITIKDYSSHIKMPRWRIDIKSPKIYRISFKDPNVALHFRLTFGGQTKLTL